MIEIEVSTTAFAMLCLLRTGKHLIVCDKHINPSLFFRWILCLFCYEVRLIAFILLSVSYLSRPVHLTCLTVILTGEISVYTVRWQRQRYQKHLISTTWCVSELDFMIISSRAKSKMNYLQNSSQLRLLRKCSFASLLSCDANLTKTHKSRLVKHVMC
jgi:hypothetical protein